MIPEAQIALLLKEMLMSDSEVEAGLRLEEKIDHVAARLACHASIRSGKEMTKQEVMALFAALDSTEFSAACPHGRPIAVSFLRGDVERWFGRDR